MLKSWIAGGICSLGPGGSVELGPDGPDTFLEAEFCGASVEPSVAVSALSVVGTRSSSRDVAASSLAIKEPKLASGTRTVTFRRCSGHWPNSGSRLIGLVIGVEAALGVPNAVDAYVLGALTLSSKAPRASVKVTPPLDPAGEAGLEGVLAARVRLPIDPVGELDLDVLCGRVGKPSFGPVKELDLDMMLNGWCRVIWYTKEDMCIVELGRTRSTTREGKVRRCVPFDESREVIHP